MSESKFAEPCEEFEGKFADEGECKYADASESKFADKGSDAGEEDGDALEDTTTLAISESVFGKDPIIEKLIDFWGQSFSNDINTFFADNCDYFDPDETEHSLEHTRLHKKYEKIMEEHLQEFRSDVMEDISESEMYSRLRASTEANALSQMILDLIVVCSDFPAFVQVMKGKRRQLDQGGASEGKEMDELD